MTSPQIWVVTSPSAYRTSHTCLLGSGSTKAEAAEDAFGPRESWSDSTKKAIRQADVYQIPEDELSDFRQ